MKRQFECAHPVSASKPSTIASGDGGHKFARVNAHVDGDWHCFMYCPGTYTHMYMHAYMLCIYIFMHAYIVYMHICMCIHIHIYATCACEAYVCIYMYGCMDV